MKFNQDFLLRVACHLVYGTCRLLQSTYRYKYTGLENFRKVREIHPSGSFIMAIWHEFAIPGILSQRGKPYTVLVSASKDGEFVAFVTHRMGQMVVRGSSSRGGLEARNELLSVLENGFPISITVDGPRGPRRKCKPGVVDMARKTGIPILPVSVAMSNPWTFKKSWDQTKIPWPFSRAIFRYGKPFVVEGQLESKEEFEHCLKQLGDSLNNEGEEAERDLERWKDLPSGWEGTHLILKN